MKIAHRNPTAAWFHVPESATVDPSYAAEVQRHTDRGEREHQRREARLARAEARLAKAQAVTRQQPSHQHLAELQAQVELRRAELEQYRRSMTSAPASAQHRGTRSFRPVPPVQGVPL